jgi:ribosome recycling factor
MNEAIFAQLQKEMDHSLGALRKELAKLRTGRASTNSPHLAPRSRAC